MLILKGNISLCMVRPCLWDHLADYSCSKSFVCHLFQLISALVLQVNTNASFIKGYYGYDIWLDLKLKLPIVHVLSGTIGGIKAFQSKNYLPFSPHPWVLGLAIVGGGGQARFGLGGRDWALVLPSCPPCMDGWIALRDKDPSAQTDTVDWKRYLPANYACGCKKFSLLGLFVK